MKKIKNILWSDFFFKEKKKSLSDALKKVDLFSDLNKRQLRDISKITFIRKYKKGEAIFKKDDPSYGLFIVLKGEVDIFIQNKNKKLILGNYENSEYFGEFALAKENTRKASAFSKEDSTLCYIFREDLNKLFIQNPRLGISVYQKVIELLIEKLEYADECLIKWKGQ